MGGEKKVSVETTVAADADTVWRALTEAEELSRWFPPQARVTPGKGGSIWLSWGEGAEWEAPIEVWEPQRHLRTVDPPPGKIAVDYFIESQSGGETVLRIVQTGFGADAWDDETEQTMTCGWRAFLANLRLYLEHHRGEPRTMARFRHPALAKSREDAFRRMLAVFGFDPEADLRPGQRFAVTAAPGDRLEGVVAVFGRPVNLSATIENLGNAFLMIEIEPGRERCRPAFWLSLYGDADDAAALENRFRAEVTRALAQR
jgi:uncharacterized protein YndB with AHSA1/START domain